MTCNVPRCPRAGGMPVTFPWGGKQLHGVIANDMISVRLADGQLFPVPSERLEPDAGEWPEGDAK